MGDRIVIDVATPAFLVLILVEWLVAPGRFSLSDSVSSLSAGAIEAIGSKLVGSVLALPYGAVRGWLVARGLALTVRGPALLLVVLLVDLSYYLGHRGAHRMNLAWAGHTVHHSRFSPLHCAAALPSLFHRSEHYNLTTALRQGALERFFSAAYRLPLALFVPFGTFQVLFDLNLGPASQL